MRRATTLVPIGLLALAGLFAVIVMLPDSARAQTVPYNFSNSSSYYCPPNASYPCVTPPSAYTPPTVYPYSNYNYNANYNYNNNYNGMYGQPYSMYQPTSYYHPSSYYPSSSYIINSGINYGSYGYGDYATSYIPYSYYSH